MCGTGLFVLGLFSWEILQQHLDVGVPEGCQHSVKVSLDTAKPDQHNIIVRSIDGGYYHARFAVMIEQL